MSGMVKWLVEHKEIILASVVTIGWFLVAVISLVLIVFVLLQVGL